MNKIDAEGIRKRNNQDRMWYVEYWAEYVRTHPDRDWSRQQKVIIDSQMKNARQLTPEEYLKIKG